MSFLKFIVSACLAGVRCRYDGGDSKDDKIFRLVKNGKALPFCPEQLGGLTTPRSPSRIKSSSGKVSVISNSGVDLSRSFLRGADLSFRMAKRFKIDFAYLKRKSPSCGYRSVENKRKAAGITSNLLVKKGMRIFPR